MEDIIKLPLDVDGVPIRPGDVLWLKEHPEDEPLTVASLRYLDRESISWDFTAIGKDAFYLPKAFTHTKPDTLETIEKAINELIEEATLDYLAKAEIKEKVAPLMERIKRMVEK